MSRYEYRSPGAYGGLGFGGMLTPAIKRLLIANGIVFVAQFLLVELGIDLVRIFGLIPRDILRGMIWQLFSYMFLHGGILHILFNMLILWLFGSEIERHWGSKEFLKYYFITGVGGGICAVLFFWNSDIPVIGASGAVFGILLAYGMTFPNRLIYLWFIFPIPAKYFVMIMGAITFFSLPSSDGVAHIAHLGGMIFGFLYIKSDWRMGQFFSNLKRFLPQQKPKPKYPRKTESMQPHDLRQQIDQILDRINEVGYENLSEEERRILIEASRRLSETEHLN